MTSQAQMCSATTLLILLAACSSEPRSVEYFANHLDETDQIIKDCETGSANTAECKNASMARLRAKNKASYEEEARKSAEAMKSGNFMPTIRR